MMDTMTLKAGLSAALDMFATSCEDWILSLHPPYDVSEAQDGSDMRCVRCKAKAPCREYIRTLDRRAERRAGR